ncbi:MAG: pyruvate formate lyase family protein [Erysipelotrichaceae bacterium]|nr:pyruvate formate lyase family protein [Erysipelotrichaceae bacterium]
MSLATRKLREHTNVEIKSKLACEKSPREQVEIMELYTETHRKFSQSSKSRRELECLKVIYPRLLRTILPDDLLAGRMDFLPIGFGAVTSVGGVGHYCHFANLYKLRDSIEEEDLLKRIDALDEYWTKYDTRTQYSRNYRSEVVYGDTMQTIYNAPITAGPRLSGMMLDYNKLCDLGITGLKNVIKKRLEEEPDNEFLQCSLEAMDLFTVCCDYYIDMIDKDMETADEQRKYELQRIRDSLCTIRTDKPVHFMDALEATWLYALLAGCINYGRLDDVLGDYLVKDFESGYLTKEEAHKIVRSLWVLIENKRTTVNGRLIVGGRGRRNPAAADEFARICLDVCKEMRQVEPQFTLRLYEDTPKDIWDKAMDCLADGATFPTLYNDEVTIPGLAHCMRVPEKEAEQYAMFGCGEMNLQTYTVGTPNAVINLLKLVTIQMNEGVDPIDGRYKAGPVILRKLEDYHTYEEFWEDYCKLSDYYNDMCVKQQVMGYHFMNTQVSFLFVSNLMNDCIARGKPLLDGGVRYLGGCNETYGNINASDSLVAIKKLVFEDKKYTLREVNNALLADFVGYEQMQQDLKDAPKYGNDDPYADEIANDVYNLVAKRNYEMGPEMGLHYYGIVIINNQTNTFWGNSTSASPDGRNSRVFMNPSNNPQGGADKSGPTAMLNSLVKFDPHYQVGQVQNIKFQKNFFKDNIEKIGLLFKGYFKKGGCQLMVTVIDHHALEDAMIHPENHQNLIVRVSGFSAVFVNLSKNVQLELLSRTMYNKV